MEFADIHCHILPCMDDGPRMLSESLAMARLAVEQGVATVLATPHQLGNHADNSAAAVREAVAWFQEALDVRRIPLRVLPGADIRIEADLPARIAAGEVVSLADRNRHVLLELPHEVFLPLDGLLGRLEGMGLTAILSHPERNRAIQSNPGQILPLVENGCLMQVTTGSLLGAFGNSARCFAEWLIERRLVHVVATDAHDPLHRRPDLREAFDRLVKLAGREVAATLCCVNPARIVAGEAAHAPPRAHRRLIAVLWPW